MNRTLFYPTFHSLTFYYVGTRRGGRNYLALWWNRDSFLSQLKANLLSSVEMRKTFNTWDQHLVRSAPWFSHFLKFPRSWGHREYHLSIRLDFLTIKFWLQKQSITNWKDVLKKKSIYLVWPFSAFTTWACFDHRSSFVVLCPRECSD